MNEQYETLMRGKQHAFLKPSYYSGTTIRPAILLVEDNETDQISIQRCFRKRQSDIELITAMSGYEALDILHERREQKMVVLTDISMPGIDGIELLFEIRKDDHLRKNPVFILSGSDQPGDISHAYDCGATGYLLKRDSMNEMQRIVSFLIDYCEMIELPNPLDQYDG